MHHRNADFPVCFHLRWRLEKIIVSNIIDKFLPGIPIGSYLLSFCRIYCVIFLSGQSFPCRLFFQCLIHFFIALCRKKLSQNFLIRFQHISIHIRSVRFHADLIRFFHQHLHIRNCSPDILHHLFNINGFFPALFVHPCTVIQPLLRIRITSGKFIQSADDFFHLQIFPSGCKSLHKTQEILVSFFIFCFQKLFHHVLLQKL